MRDGVVLDCTTTQQADLAASNRKTMESRNLSLSARTASALLNLQPDAIPLARSYSKDPSVIAKLLDLTDQDSSGNISIFEVLGPKSQSARDTGNLVPSILASMRLGAGDENVKAFSPVPLRPTPPFPPVVLLSWPTLRSLVG